MFLSYGLYVCIILETAHHRTTFGRFCSITQNTTPEENSQKMFHISWLIVLFLMGRSRTLTWRIRIKFHLGSTKGWGRRGYGVKGGMEGEAQNKGYVLQNFQYEARCKIYFTNCWSDNLWFTIIAFDLPLKHICRDFEVILNSSS